MLKNKFFLITCVLVALITYLPTIAEIYCAKHISLFNFFVPFIIFPDFFKMKGFWPIVALLAVPFALLKGVAWGIVAYLFNMAGQKANNITMTVILLLIFIFLLISMELIGSFGMVFMLAAAMSGF